MDLIKISNVTLTSPSFRTGHQGVDVTGDYLTSDKLTFQRIDDFDYIGVRNGRAYVKILHVKQRGSSLIPAHDYKREVLGRWTGFHFHIEMMGKLRNVISPALLFKTYNATSVERKMLALPILELTLPLSDKIQRNNYFDFEKLLDYIQLLMPYEGSFALDNGVRRRFGYEEALWHSSYQYSELITFSKLLRPYLLRAFTPKGSEFQIPLIRRLDLAFQYKRKWWSDLSLAYANQIVRYPGRIRNFKSLGASYGNNY